MTPSEGLAELYKSMPSEPDGSELDLAHFFGAGVYARRITITKGRIARFHVHTYDHLTIIATGRGRLLKQDGVTVVKAGECIEVKAGLKHAFQADEDTTIFCVHGDEPEAVALYGGKR